MRRKGVILSQSSLEDELYGQICFDSRLDCGLFVLSIAMGAMVGVVERDSLVKTTDGEERKLLILRIWAVRPCVLEYKVAT